MGYLEISPSEVIKIILARIIGDHEILNGLNHVFPYVVWEVRLPRILTSAIVGVGLSISGVIFQGILLAFYSIPWLIHTPWGYRQEQPLVLP
jgi:iron complex transport system permease protein